MSGTVNPDVARAQWLARHAKGGRGVDTTPPSGHAQAAPVPATPDHPLKQVWIASSASLGRLPTAKM
eukprot:2426728-Alexandrium_andersonii.AAC.1